MMWTSAVPRSVSLIYSLAVLLSGLITYAWRERSCRSCSGAGISGGNPWAEEPGQGHGEGPRRKRRLSACARHQQHRQWPATVPVSVSCPSMLCKIHSSSHLFGFSGF